MSYLIYIRLAILNVHEVESTLIIMPISCSSAVYVNFPRGAAGRCCARVISRRFLVSGELSQGGGEVLVFRAKEGRRQERDLLGLKGV